MPDRIDPTVPSPLLPEHLTPPPPKTVVVERSPMLDEALRSRVTVVGRTYFQNHAQQPVCSEDAYSFKLDTQEEPWSYRVKLAGLWVPLDLGWLEDASLVRIANYEGKWGHDSEEALSQRVIEVGLCLIVDGPTDYHCFGLVRAGRAIQWEPGELCVKNLRLRCVAGAMCQVTLFPR